MSLLAAILLLAPGLPARAAPELACWDFESDDGGMALDEILPVWEWGEPSSGPGEAWSGTRLWATDLDDFYINNNEASLILPDVDLTGASRPVLSLWQWYQLRPGDEARFEVEVGGDWQVIEPIYGYPEGGSAFAESIDDWQDVYVDLTGLDSSSQVRLSLVSDSTGVSVGWYVDDLCLHDGDIVPPRIGIVDSPTEWQRMDVGPTITASVEDDVGLTTLLVRWSTEELAEQESYMSVAGSDNWQTTLPALEPGQTITWQIEASDGSNTTTWPSHDQGEIRVFLPAPLDLAGPDERLWATTVPLTWSPPDSVEVVSGYRVYRDELLVAEVDAPPAEAPALGPVDRFTVTALYDTELGTFEGEPAGPVEVKVAVPQLHELSPGDAYQGDRIRVELSGEQLLLEDSPGTEPLLDLGEGITVEAVEVVHVDLAAFTLAIDEDATTGLRDALVQTGGLTLELPEAFEVVDGADRPTLVNVSPEGLEQGESGEVRITASTTLAGDLLVDLGEGVVVEEVSLDGATAVVAVAVANDAPVGTNAVELDDGARIMTLEAGFRIYARASSGKGCQVGPGAAGGLLWLLPALWARRRRGAASPSARTPTDRAG